MAKILQVIPPSVFELIGDSICNILQEELNNQVLLQYDETIATNIFLERIVPPNESEFPCIFVGMANLEGDPSKLVNGDGVITYFIDLYFQEIGNEEEVPGSIAARQMKKTAGLIRQILKNPAYRCLDFDKGVIGKTVVSRINIIDNMKQDTNNTVVGRITFEISATDNYELAAVVNWTRFTTVTNIGDSDAGHKYELQA